MDSVIWIRGTGKAAFEKVTFKVRHKLTEGMSCSDAERIASQAGEPQVQNS